MIGASIDAWTFLCGMLVAVHLGAGWKRMLADQRESIPSWRHRALFFGFGAASVSLILWWIEMVLEFRHRDTHAFDLISSPASLLFFASLVGVLWGQGRGRILLALAAVLTHGLWLSITP